MDPGEDLAIRYKLEQADDEIRERAASDLALAKLHPNIRPLFEFSEGPTN